MVRKALLMLAGGRGFEPRLTDPESGVLPLDDPPAAIIFYHIFELLASPANENSLRLLTGVLLLFDGTETAWYNRINNKKGKPRLV